MTTYGFLPIAGISLMTYLVSYLLTKTRYLKFVKHRRIWNFLLLCSFIVAGSMGIFMAFVLSFELDIDIPYIILQMHVGGGVVWFIIAFFHFLWHRTYFTKTFKVLFAKREKV